jgi:hypothetical protein
VSDVGHETSLTGRPNDQPTPDTVTRQLNQLIDQPIRRSIMERYGLTRVPGTVYYDESGEVA